MKFGIALLIFFTFIIPYSAKADVKLGDRGAEVKTVQEHLKFVGGYSVKVDGIYGLQTARAVRHWQKSNGLLVDGIVGPVTAASLAIRSDSIQVTEPPKSPGGPCDEMSWYRRQVGLPDHFDYLGRRESGCDNTQTSRTGCCHGWWQNYLSSHLSTQSAYRDRIINECGVTQVSDIRGTSDAQKRASACVTKVVYDVSGLTPWAT